MKTTALVTAYLVAIVLANLSIAAWGPGVAIVNAFAFIALDLTSRLLRERAYLLRVNGSNLVSAAADSLLFPALAFGLPLLWPIVLGQFVAKVAGGALWTLALGRRA